MGKAEVQLVTCVLLLALPILAVASDCDDDHGNCGLNPPTSHSPPPPPHHSAPPPSPPPPHYPPPPPPPSPPPPHYSSPPPHHDDSPPPPHHDDSSPPPPPHHDDSSPPPPPPHHDDSSPPPPPPHHDDSSPPPPSPPPPHHDDSSPPPPPPHHDDSSPPPPSPHHDDSSPPPPSPPPPHHDDSSPPPPSPPPPHHDDSSPPPPPHHDDSSPPPPSPPPPHHDDSSPPPPPHHDDSSPPPPPHHDDSSPPPPPSPSPPPPPSPSPPPPPSSPPPPSPSPPPPPSSPPPPSLSPQPPSHPPPHPLPPPPPPSTKKGKCTMEKYTDCYGQEFNCPDNCPGGDCVVDCITCKPLCKCDIPGAVCQDPRFIGGDGITFYFHGKKDRDFCLISDSNIHINAHFIGRRNQDMHRDFTWVQSLGILFDTHRLYISALKTSTWDQSVDRLALTFDGEPILLPQSESASWQATTIPTTVSVTRTHYTNAVTIEVQGNFKITATVVPITEEESRVHNYGITKDDCFAHLELGFKFYTLSNNVHGVLGQTYREDYTSRVKISAAMPVMGGVHEFSSSDLFSTDCLVSRFHKGGLSIIGAAGEYADMECKSGMTGRGIVCKK